MSKQGPFIVFGASGCLGAEIYAQLSRTYSENVFGACRHPSGNQIYFDLAKPLSWILPKKVSYGIIAAGATQRSFCQNNPDESYRLNVTNTIQLAREINDRGGRVVFLSTNMVFDGSKPDFMPSDPVSPFDNYGAQKAEVEGVILNECQSALIIRLTKVFHSSMPLFLDLHKYDSMGKTSPLFTNVAVSPISPKYVVKSVTSLISHDIFGIYHLSGDISLKYSEVGCMAAKEGLINSNLLEFVRGAKNFEYGTLGISQEGPIYSDNSLLALKKSFFN
jgi:dTDP-4-dehydrorhamnose reductase